MEKPFWSKEVMKQDDARKYYAYIVSSECITIFPPHRKRAAGFGNESETHLAKCLPSSVRYRVRPFGYKNTLRLVLLTTEGNRVQVVITNRQFVYNPMTSRYTKAMDLHLGDFVLCKMRMVCKIENIQSGGYREVVELCSSDREMYCLGTSFCQLGVASFATYRENEAVESFGIIACRCIQPKGSQLPEEPKREYLLVQRRDTMAYRDLIRGQYCNQPIDDICLVYFQEMTGTERERVLTWPFDKLWYSIWNNDVEEYFTSPVRLTKQYKEAKSKYEQLDLTKLATLAGPPLYTEPEFGLPKGRPMKNELKEQTALREFMEEVGLKTSQQDFLVILPASPLIESFRATNGLRYTHTYFLAHFTSAQIDFDVDSDNELQASEIGSVSFETLQNALQLFRPYDRVKKEILIEADLKFQSLLPKC